MSFNNGKTIKYWSWANETIWAHDQTNSSLAFGCEVSERTQRKCAITISIRVEIGEYWRGGKEHRAKHTIKLLDQIGLHITACVCMYLLGVSTQLNPFSRSLSLSPSQKKVAPFLYQIMLQKYLNWSVFFRFASKSRFLLEFATSTFGRDESFNFIGPFIQI